MNTARRLTQLTMITATLAAVFVARATDVSVAAPCAVRFDTVVVTGHRAAPVEGAVVQLPTVVVTATRDQYDAARAVEMPLVTVIGHRAAGDATLFAQRNSHAATPKSAV